METNVQITLFKQVATRWLHNMLDQLLGDGLMQQLVRPILDEMIDKYSKNDMVDAFLSLFVDEDGNFNIDRLLDKYIASFANNGGIRFKWGDIYKGASFLDNLSGGKVNVITAEDIRQLKDSFIKGI